MHDARLLYMYLVSPRTIYKFAQVCRFSKAYAGEAQRPDVAALVGCGIFNECVSAAKAFAACGSIDDIDTYALLGSLMHMQACQDFPLHA